MSRRARPAAASAVAAAALGLSLTLLGCPDGRPPAPSPVPSPRPSAGPRFTVRLLDGGPRPEEAIAAVVSARGCTRAVAAALVERAGKPASLPVLVGAPAEQAQAALAALRAAGARAELESAP